MERKLNNSLIRDAADRQGFSFAEIGRQLDVSTESVSKWMNGESKPRPGMAIKLGRLLELTYDQMFGLRDRSDEPQVAFRLVNNAAPSEEHHDRAREMGRLYEQLAEHLPFSRFEAPTQLKMTSLDYSALHVLCNELRREMGLTEEEPVSFPSLFGHLSDKLQAVVIPMFWEHREKGAESAAHIYSPKTMTTWIPLNLDSRAWDVRFMIAHELAHAYTFKTLDAEAGEAFADAFAGSFVFPERVAARAYADMSAAATQEEKVKVAIAHGAAMLVSPICVAKQVDRYAIARNLAPAGTLFPRFYELLEPIKAQQETMAQQLFGAGPPAVRDLVERTKIALRSPFFDALSEFLKTHGGNPAFVQALLDCPMADAKALNSELA